MAVNVGFALESGNTITFRRQFQHKDDGHFEQLLVGPHTPLRATVSHPRLAGLTFSSDFTPDHCPIWGNSNTWSIEPYLTTELAPGTRREFTLRYDFGAARSG